MSLEKQLELHTVALNALTAAITANTETMRSLTPSNVVPITPPAEKSKATPTQTEARAKTQKLLDADPPITAEMVEPAEKEKPAPVEEKAPEPEAPAAEEPVTPAEDPSTWDDAKLKLAIQEFVKTKLVDPKTPPSFKESYTAELAKLGIDKAAKLTPEQRLPFYQAALTW